MCGLMVKHIKDNGLEASNMEWASLQWQMDRVKKENGRMERESDG